MSEIARMVVLICRLTTADAECTMESIEAIDGPVVSSFEACLALAEEFEKNAEIRDALRRRSAESFAITCVREPVSEPAAREGRPDR